MVASLRRLIARAQPWPDHLARGGFVAKGLVYLAVGGLAIAAAFGGRGQATDPAGALGDAATTTAGRASIGVVGLGLVMHALFRAALAIVGEPYDAQNPLRRLLRRVANAASTLGYLALGATALALSVGLRSSGRTNDDASAQRWAAFALHAPFGHAALAVVAFALTVAAVVQMVLALWPQSVPRRLQTEDMSERERFTATVIGRMAFLSRGSILGAIAYFLWKSLVLAAPGDVRGPGGALHAFWEEPHGDVVLAIVASGLVAVGAFALIEARWRRLFTGKPISWGR